MSGRCRQICGCGVRVLSIKFQDAVGFWKQSMRWRVFIEIGWLRTSHNLVIIIKLTGSGALSCNEVHILLVLYNKVQQPQIWSISSNVNQIVMLNESHYSLLYRSDSSEPLWWYEAIINESIADALETTVKSHIWMSHLRGK